MHTMFTIRKTSNANSQAQAEAAASIAATMQASANHTNRLEGSNVIQNSNLPSLAASLASNPISQYYDVVGKPCGSAGRPLFNCFLFFQSRRS